MTVADAVHTRLARTSILTATVMVADDALKELPIVLLLRALGFDTLAVWTLNLTPEIRLSQVGLSALASDGPSRPGSGVDDEPT